MGAFFLYSYFKKRWNTPKSSFFKEKRPTLSENHFKNPLNCFIIAWHYDKKVTYWNFTEEKLFKNETFSAFILTHQYSISQISNKTFGQHIGKYISSKNIAINNQFLTF